MSSTPPSFRYHLRDIPGPKALPLIGNMHQIKGGQFHVSLEQWSQRYGPFFKMHVGSKAWLVLADPNLYASILRDRPDGFSRLSSTIRGSEEIKVRGVFIAQGEEWRKQRKLVMRALTAEVVQRFFPQMQSMVERMRLRWERQVKNGEKVDLLRDLKSFTLDITVALAFGQDINTLENPANPLQHDIETVFRRMAQRMTSPIKYWRYMRLPADYAADAATARIAEAIASFIAQTRQLMQAEPERKAKPCNLMEALIAARDEEGSEFNDEHVSGNAMTMVFAGEDTTSNSIAWMIDALSHEPKCCMSLREELDRISGNARVLPEYAMLQQLPYLEAAVQETLRLKPAGPFMGAENLREMVVNDILLPANTPIILLLRQAGMQSTTFPEPEKFLPERWLTEGNVDQTMTRKLFVFGGGPRLCPGRFLALVEIKMLAAMLIKNFDLVLQPGQTVEEIFSFTMTPSCLPVDLRLRTS